MDRANGAGPGAAASRAERFDDEKRRIIDTCFNKKDPDGGLQETYITHIRVTEFSSHPAAPPPPEARNPGSEKPRIIIIAVRRSGRVRMHKSKENPNGTYSIGKTWNLDDLTHIESFTSLQANPQHREWAGDTGFLVTLGKPYYWQAQTDKEKKFFIASMIKIYGKYTSGKVPELTGFDQKELDQVLGAGKRTVNANANGPPPMRPPPSSSMSSQPSLHMAGSSGSTLHDAPPPKSTKTPPVRYTPSTAASPAGSFDSTASRDKDRLNLRKVAQNNKSQDSVGGYSHMTGKSEDASSILPRSRNGMPGPGAFGRFGDPRDVPEPPTQPLPLTPGQSSPHRPPSRTRNEQANPYTRAPSRSRDEATPDSLRPGSHTRDDQVPVPAFARPPSRAREEPVPSALRPGSRAREDQTPPPVRSASRPRDDQTPPERRRPPMDPTRPQDRDLVPPPLMNSASTKREPVAPPPRSLARKESVNRPPVPLPAPVSSAAVVVDFDAPDAMAQSEAPRSQPRLAEPIKSEPPPAARTEPAPPQSDPEVKAHAAEEEEILPPPVPADPEEARPGLGPMIKSKKSKGDIAGAFWKAASAATAFKPRPGGAGDRLRQQAQKPAEGPDGITGVVPAPPRPVSTEQTPTPELPAKAPQRSSNVPEVKISVPKTASRPSSIQEPSKEVAQPADVVTNEVAPTDALTRGHSLKDESAPKEIPRRPAAAANDAKFLHSLDIDSSILDAKSVEFGAWLDFFGWVPGDQMRKSNVDDIKIDLERELNKAQAGGWLARFEEGDERVEAIKGGIDQAMAECEELDNLLTLYSVELSTLSEDISFIEAQGQGLQVQTANQKLLKKELESLLETCAITSNDLEALRLAPLDHVRGLEDVESSLITLYKAMRKIDPSLGANEPTKDGNATLDSDQAMGLNSDYGNMRIVQEKKEMYVQESTAFMLRLVDFMPRQFDQSIAETKRGLEGALSKKVDPSHHEAGRDILWKYHPLMLYARDADLINWNRFIQLYQDKTAPLYKNEFQTVIQSWRKNAHKMTADETSGLLFTSQLEKQQENVATTARKLTVKRSQTLARALRSPLSDGSKAERQKPGSENKSFPYEVFAGVLDDLLPLVEMEQNFIVDFFHATTLEQADFPDAVAASSPRDRRGGDLRRHRLMEPDRDLARRVTRAMEIIFQFLDGELQRLMEWVIAQDPLQGVGVFVTMEKKMADLSQTNQDFLNTIFQKQHGLLGGRFRKFVDDQIRAIEETKVKIHKRKGVIHFIRVFPTFSTAIENMLAGIDPNLPIRRTVDKEYDRMLKSMFESLLVIAREHPAVAVTGGGGDPEDKEALNFHILLIENMKHFADATDTRGLEVLEVWKENANTEYNEHLGLYLNAVMRRPLGKLLDHLENIEAQLQSGKTSSAIAAQPSNSKNIFNKVLGNYDAKEVKKGIEALRKRVEKHFGDTDEPAASKDLVDKVWEQCRNFYETVEQRIERVVTDIYGGDVLFEWPRAEVRAAFRG